MLLHVLTYGFSSLNLSFFPFNFIFLPRKQTSSPVFFTLLTPGRHQAVPVGMGCPSGLCSVLHATPLSKYSLGSSGLP